MLIHVISNIENVISATSGKESLHTGSYFWYSFHLLFPHWLCDDSRPSSRMDIIKVLAGANWGQLKGSILITYKSLIWSLSNHAAPIRFPNASSSMFRKLQTLQNTAPRVASGCVKMTSIDHLSDNSYYVSNISKEPSNLGSLHKM